MGKSRGMRHGRDDLDSIDIDGEVFEGTDGNDSFLGGDLNDVMTGSAGNDRFLGGDGIDVADYSDLGTAVTVGSPGSVTKGNLGEDTLGGFDVETGELEVVEVIVGAENEANLIDATSVVGAVNANVNLAEETSTYTVVNPVGGFEEGAEFSVDIVNFVDVNGTDNDDTIVGDDEANVIAGAGGDDILTGGGDEDTFVFDGTDDGVDTITDFSRRDTLSLEVGFGALSGEELSYRDLFSRDGDGKEIIEGDDVLTVDGTSGDASLLYNGTEFAVFQNDDLIA